ncbi:hypothetical protein GCM10023195_87460 [Actinoallomurus liliacearum]|uniref:Lipoprotein LpqB beta-propeller domain-containing protein n=2 Tax=Actinoallomurus liliacearum TaxID=1080073 RepID=A0ABP8U1T0_9ACTN
MSMGRFVTIGGRNDGSVPQELVVHHAAPDGHPVHVAPPPGETWDATVAVRGDTIAATTHSIDDPATPPRLYTITEARGVRPVPLPPIRHGRAIDLAISPDGADIFLVLDAGDTERDEYLLVAPASGDGPVRVWPLDPAAHVLGISAGPDRDLAMLTVGAAGRPQHRRVVRSRTPTSGTLLVEDGDHGIHQLRAAEISADGSRLALAYTGDEGATVSVAVLSVDGGPLRVLWQRPCSWGDPDEVRLSFDRTGQHLLLSYGEVIAVAVTDATHHVLTRAAENRWQRAAW